MGRVTQRQVLRTTRKQPMHSRHVYIYVDTPKIKNPMISPMMSDLNKADLFYTLRLCYQQKYILKKSFKTVIDLKNVMTEHSTTRKRLVQVLREVTYSRIYVFNTVVLKLSAQAHQIRIMEISGKRALGKERINTSVCLWEEELLVNGCISEVTIIHDNLDCDWNTENSKGICKKIWIEYEIYCKHCSDVG